MTQTATANPRFDMPNRDTTGRDTSFIECDEWPMRPLETFVGHREDKFQVVFSQSALDEIHIHGQGSNDIEVCGVLIGNGYRDEHGPYLLVEHCIRGNGARTRSTNVTFTADTWAYIQDEMDRDHPDSKMIGWYHTHPGFGIFLSDMDVFICDNFFNLPWQVAFVYDPLSGDEGNFVWRGGKPVREGILVEDDVTPLSAKIPLISKTDAMRSDALSPASFLSDATPARSITVPDRSADEHMDPKLIELLIRIRRLETRQKKIAISFVFLATFVVIWAVEFSAVPFYGKSAPATQPTAAADPAAPALPAAVPAAGQPLHPQTRSNRIPSDVAK